MSRETFVYINEKLVCKARDGELTDEYLALANCPSESVFHGYGSDTLPGGVNGIYNHADGKRYDSKSEYTRAVRAKGCRIVGNDLPNPVYKTPIEKGIRGDFNVRPDLKRALNMVGHG